MAADSSVIGRIHCDDPLSAAYLAIALASLPLSNIVRIVCVGTDRSTGDSLGPFIGTFLQRKQKNGLLPNNISVYGTLAEPVHALNLEERIHELTSFSELGTLIAIDACLGRMKNVGYISLKKGPLRPGTGVQKRLPALGDFHIIGVVNVAGFMEQMVLQNTRLSLVVQMAEIISEAIIMTLGSFVPASQAGASLGATLF